MLNQEFLSKGYKEYTNHVLQDTKPQEETEPENHDITKNWRESDYHKTVIIDRNIQRNMYRAWTYPVFGGKSKDTRSLLYLNKVHYKLLGETLMDKILGIVGYSKEMDRQTLLEDKRKMREQGTTRERHRKEVKGYKNLIFPCDYKHESDLTSLSFFKVLFVKDP